MAKTQLAKIEGQIEQARRRLVEVSKESPTKQVGAVEKRIRSACAWLENLEAIADTDYDSGAVNKMLTQFVDRSDIHIEVPAVPFEELSSQSRCGTSSEQMRVDVMKARELQADRFADCCSGVRYNAQMTSPQVREHCELNPTCQQMLRHSVEEMGLSARA